MTEHLRCIKKERDVLQRKYTDQEFLDNLLAWSSLSKPVYKSLSKIIRKDPIERIEGSCGTHKSLTPFYVRLKSGKILCKATSIHAYCKDLQEGHAC